MSQTVNAGHPAQTTKLEVGQVWADRDIRNALELEGGAVKPRTVQIKRLPSGSRKGVMRVLYAPRNRGSEGQLRQFSEGQLRSYYFPTPQGQGGNMTDQPGQAVDEKTGLVPGAVGVAEVDE